MERNYEKYSFAVSMAGVDGIGFDRIVIFRNRYKNRKEQDEFITETVI